MYRAFALGFGCVLLWLALFCFPSFAQAQGKSFVYPVAGYASDESATPFTRLTPAPRIHRDDIGAAHAAAVAERKPLVVFIRPAASSPFLAPGKRLLDDEETLRALGARYTILEIDSGVATDAATRFRVRVLPSLSAWSTDGVELWRLEGPALDPAAVAAKLASSP